MIVCKRVVYSGHVQGVGFRYTALALSRNYQVAGTVRNCADGRVEMNVEGQKDQVEAFMAAIAEQMEGYIAEQTVHELGVMSMRGFEIIR